MTSKGSTLLYFFLIQEHQAVRDGVVMSRNGSTRGRRGPQEGPEGLAESILVDLGLWNKYCGLI